MVAATPLLSDTPEGSLNELEMNMDTIREETNILQSSLPKSMIHLMFEQVYGSSEGQYKYYASIPNIADDNLSLHEYRLYGHYVRVCGQNGNYCNEAEETTARHCGMGKQKMREARKALAEKGYIRVIKGTPHKEGKKGEPTRVYIENVWPENILTYDKSKKAMTVKQRLQSNTDYTETGEDLPIGSVFDNGSNQTPSEGNGFHQTSSDNLNGSNQTPQQGYPDLKEKKEPLNKKHISAPSAQSATPTARTICEDSTHEQEAFETQNAKVEANAPTEVEERALVKFLNQRASQVGPTVKQVLESTLLGIDFMGNEVEHISPVDRYDLDSNFRKYVVDQIDYWRKEGNGKIRNQMMPLAYSLLNVDTRHVGYFDWCKKHKIIRYRTVEELNRYHKGCKITIDEDGVQTLYIPESDT